MSATAPQPPALVPSAEAARQLAEQIDAIYGAPLLWELLASLATPREGDPRCILIEGCVAVDRERAEVRRQRKRVAKQAAEAAHVVQRLKSLPCLRSFDTGRRRFIEVSNGPAVARSNNLAHSGLEVAVDVLEGLIRESKGSAGRPRDELRKRAILILALLVRKRPSLRVDDLMVVARSSQADWRGTRPLPRDQVGRPKRLRDRFRPMLEEARNVTDHIVIVPVSARNTAPAEKPVRSSL